MTVAEILSVNGQTDDQEPWCAADDCDTIDIRGEDMVALADDGCARWTNSQREWTEVTPANLARTLDDVYASHSGGNRVNAEKLYAAMEAVWEDLRPLEQLIEAHG